MTDHLDDWKLALHERDELRAERDALRAHLDEAVELLTGWVAAGDDWLLRPPFEDARAFLVRLGRDTTTKGE